MAPYAVLIDPYRAMQTLGVEGETLFSPDVNYIYRKQLEEAEIIVINKVDIIPAERLARLKVALGREYPDAQILALSSREGKGMEPLFEALTKREGQTRRVMEVDYDRYGKGEALLGWYNGRFAVKSRGGLDGNTWLVDLARRMRAVFETAEVEIAHLKMSLTDGESPADGKSTPEMAAVSLVRTEGEPELRR
jgi:G3E family GTPase